MTGLGDFTERRTFHTLDGLRGAAALAVLSLHYQTPLRPILLPSAYLAVDLFFIMSGIVIAYAYEGRIKAGMHAGRFFLIRWIRLMPLYLFGWALTVAMVGGALAIGKSQSWTWDLFLPVAALAGLMIPNFAPLAKTELYPLNPPAWSLAWELAINLVYGLIGARLSTRWLAVIVVLAGAVLAGTAIYAGNLDFGYQKHMWLVGLPRVAFAFPLGVLIFRLLAAGRLPRLPVPSWCLVLLTVAALALPASGGWIKDLGCVLIAFPLICAAAVRNEPRRPRFYAFLGLISYPVYVMQIPLPMERVAETLMHGSTTRFAPFTGIAIAGFIMLVAYALGRWYDPVARRLLTRIILHRRPRAEAAMS